MRIKSLFLIMGLSALFGSFLWAQTPVSDSINISTTWTLEGSPYVLTGNLIVAKGATLQIEAGVEVAYSDYRFNINVTDGARMEADGASFVAGDNQALIRVEEGTLRNSSFRKVQVHLAGQNSQLVDGCSFDHSPLKLLDSDGSISNCLFDATSLVYVNGKTPFSIQGCTFWAFNTVMVFDFMPESSDPYLIEGNTFYNMGRVHVELADPFLSGDFYLPADLDGLYYYFLGFELQGGFHISEGTSIRLGADLNFREGSYLEADGATFVGGRLKLMGSADLRNCYFDQAGIELSGEDRHQIDGCEFYKSPVILNGTKSTISECTFDYFGIIRALSNSPFMISNNEFLSEHSGICFEFLPDVSDSYQVSGNIYNSNVTLEIALEDPVVTGTVNLPPGIDGLKFEILSIDVQGVLNVVEGTMFRLNAYTNFTTSNGGVLQIDGASFSSNFARPVITMGKGTIRNSDFKNTALHLSGQNSQLVDGCNFSGSTVNFMDSDGTVANSIFNSGSVITADRATAFTVRGNSFENMGPVRLEFFPESNDGFVIEENQYQADSYIILTAAEELTGTINLAPSLPGTFYMIGGDVIINGTLNLSPGTTVGFGDRASWVFNGNAALNASGASFVSQYYDGIFLNDASSAVILNSTFDNSFLQFNQQTTGRVNGSNFLNRSTRYGINNTGTGIIDATGNYWNHSTGPGHSTNPGGLGCLVSDNVDFQPWSTQINAIHSGYELVMAGPVNYPGPVAPALSAVYAYAEVDETASSLPPGVPFTFKSASDRGEIAGEGKLVDNRLLQLKFDLSALPEMGSIYLAVPDTLYFGNSFIPVSDTQEGLELLLEPGVSEQSISVFAGGSLGARLIAGGVGAGPSIAAASISATGAGGMGITFTHDHQGNQNISRSFEVGVGLQAKSPAINAVVGNVQTGADADIFIKGTLGQRMMFDPGTASDATRMAKAAYMLETFSLGGVAMSPFAGVFLMTLKALLVDSNEDVEALYSQMMSSFFSGYSVEGSASAGLSFALTEGENQATVDLFDVGGGFALSRKREVIQARDLEKLSVDYSRGFNIDLLDLNVFGDVDLASAFEYSLGSQMGIRAVGPGSGSLDYLELEYGVFNSSSISLADYSRSYTYQVHVPGSVVDDCSGTDNIAARTRAALNREQDGERIKVGTEYLLAGIDTVFSHSPNRIDAAGDHVLLNNWVESNIGVSISPTIAIDAALGVGGGLKLGFNFSYLDHYSFPLTSHFMINDQLLPLYERGAMLDSDRLFSMGDEVVDLYGGLIELVKNRIGDFVETIEEIIEAGTDFWMSTLDNAVTLSGRLNTPGRMILRYLDPSSPTVKKSAFSDPVVVQGYVSSRVSEANFSSSQKSIQATKSVLAEGDEVLVLLSRAVNVSMLDENQSLLPQFDSLSLEITIDEDLCRQFDISENEKPQACIFFYNAEELTWYRIPGDLHADPDILRTRVAISGTYAVGILKSASNDNEAPEISGYFPMDGSQNSAVSEIWAEVYESPLGSGISLADTRMLLDGVELECFWHPNENRISYSPEFPLPAGNYTLTIISSDLNGNVSQLDSYFEVADEVSATLSSSQGPRFSCYPNPATDRVFIDVTGLDEGSDVRIFDNNGRLISILEPAISGLESTRLSWDMTDFQGHKVDPGVYFVRVQHKGTSLVGKVVSP